MRNIGIVAHIDAGKTTLSERILYASGSIRVCGEVHEGTTVCDFLQQERDRGISIVSAAVGCTWRGTRINIIDTPGHIDFTAEVERSLRVMDGVVAVFCALHGVQAQSEMVLRRARRYGLPVLAFVNKMDREGADCQKILGQLCKLSDAVPLNAQVPVIHNHRLCSIVDVLSGKTVWGHIPEDAADDAWLEKEEARSRLIEILADSDEELMDVFISGGEPSEQCLKRAFREATLKNRVIPVFYGSALMNIGVESLLDGVVDYLPSPADRLESLEFCRELAMFGGSFMVDDHPGICMQVFKTEKTYDGTFSAAVRMFSGRMTRNMWLHNVNGKSDFQVTAIFRPTADQLDEVDAVGPGDIAVITGEGMNAKTGDTLCGPGLKIKLARMKFPEPVMSQMVEAVGDSSREKLEGALREFTEGDPTLRMKTGPDSGRVLLSGMGELHLEIIRDRLKSDYGIETRAGCPMVAYKATVRNPAEVDETFVKQLTSDIKVDARVRVKIAPLSRNEGLHLEFPGLKPENQVCKIPQFCCEAVENAVHELAESGGPNNSPLTDMCITVLDASFVAVEASEPAFLTVTRNALQKGLQQAGLSLLEPVMRLEVSVHQDHVGNVLADLTARRARIAELESLAPGITRIVALAPLAELFGYATSLRSLTGGRAEFAAEPSDYEFSERNSKV